MSNSNNQKKYASLSTLQTFLDNLKNTFSNLGHKHTISEITDYKVDNALSPTSTNPVQNAVLDAEFEEISVSMRALDLAIDGKSDKSHSHSNATTSASGLMTPEMVTKLNGIDTGANKITVDSALSGSSTNPVQNKVLNDAIAQKTQAQIIIWGSDD